MSPHQKAIAIRLLFNFNSMNLFFFSFMVFCSAHTHSSSSASFLPLYSPICPSHMLLSHALSTSQPTTSRRYSLTSKCSVFLSKQEENKKLFSKSSSKIPANSFEFLEQMFIIILDPNLWGLLSCHALHLFYLFFIGSYQFLI